MTNEEVIKTLKILRCSYAIDVLDRIALDSAISRLMAAEYDSENESERKLDKIREVILDYSIPIDKKFYDIRDILGING